MRLSANKVARDYWVRTAENIPENKKLIGIDRMTDKIAKKTAKKVKSLLPGFMQVWYYRSHAKAALNSYKFELLGTDNFKKYEWLFTPEERWFHDQKLDRLFMLHLCKIKGKPSVAKTLKDKVIRWIHNNSTINKQASRWDEKVKKYSGKAEYLIASHLTYLATHNASTLTKDAINAFRHVNPQFLEHYANLLKGYPLIQEALKKALSAGIDPKNIDATTTAKNLATGYLEPIIIAKKTDGQDTTLEEAALKTISAIRLDQFTSLKGIIGLSKDAAINYLNIVIDQLETDEKDPILYLGTLNAIQEIDPNQPISVPALLKIEANIAKHIIFLALGEAYHKAADAVYDHTPAPLAKAISSISSITSNAISKMASSAVSKMASNAISYTASKAREFATNSIVYFMSGRGFS